MGTGQIRYSILTALFATAILATPVAHAKNEPLKGAAIGAGVGAIFGGGTGAAVGAVSGAIVGGIVKQDRKQRNQNNKYRKK
jgi:outer membrane lipoprotein SlyB